MFLMKYKLSNYGESFIFVISKSANEVKAEQLRGLSCVVFHLKRNSKCTWNCGGLNQQKYPCIFLEL